MRLKLGIISLGLWSVAQGAVAAVDTDAVRVIIKYKHQPLSVASLKSHISQSTKLPIKALNPMANGAYSLILAVPQASLKGVDASAAVLEQLRNDPTVLYAVKDRVGHFKPVPNPVMKEEPAPILNHQIQWNEFKRPGGILLESAPGERDGAWEHTTGGSKKEKDQVVVAVLDTGVELNDSLVKNLVKDESGAVFGWNFAGNNRDLHDETQSYHGTHVSGIIAGYGDVMLGVGPDLKVLTLKVANAEGMFYESAVINAIYWSVGKDVPNMPSNPYPAKVLNMSFGVDEKPGKEIDHCDEALQEAMLYVRKKGAVVAAAAGNDNVWEHYNAPGVCNGAIKIASTGPEGLRSYFSNYGPSIAFAAPGGDKKYGNEGAILSTVNPGGGYDNSGFDFYQGTSMASPHVAGVAALVFAASNKNIKPEKVEQILYTTTHDFGKSRDDNKSCVGKKPCGHGILDAKAAVKAVVDDFDVLFSSPKVDQLDIASCGKAMAAPGKKSIAAGSAIWVATKALCAEENSYQAPRIVQAKDGAIYANYGAVQYKLDQSAFSQCKVIGYDGVGCYL